MQPTNDLLTPARTFAQKTSRTCTQFIVAATLLGLSGTALAKEYLIEVIIFEHIQRNENTMPGSMYYPKISNDTFTLDTDEAIEAGYLRVTENLTLADSAQSILGSGRYRLMEHFAWRQPGLERSLAKPISINLGELSTMFLPEDQSTYKKFVPASIQPEFERTDEIVTTTLSGTIKVSLGRFLHMDAKLVFTDTDIGTSYGMWQSRKMRSTELHYIDNQRFGILTRILPIEEDELLEGELLDGEVLTDDTVNTDS